MSLAGLATRRRFVEDVVSLLSDNLSRDDDEPPVVDDDALVTASVDEVTVSAEVDDSLEAESVKLLSVDDEDDSLEPPVDDVVLSSEVGFTLKGDRVLLRVDDDAGERTLLLWLSLLLRVAFCVLSG